MRNAFQKVAPTEPTFPIPLHAVGEDPRPSFALAIMGGGSWSAYCAGELSVLVPVLSTIGDIKLISGTSGGAINAVLTASGLNDGGPNEALRRTIAFWNRVKEGGYLHDTARFFGHALPPQDRWPNIPRYALNMMSLTQLFNPLATTGATQYISALVKELIPDWDKVQNGETSTYINTIRRHIATGKEDHLILTGRDLTPQSFGASAALDALGFHQILDKQNPIDILRELQFHYRDGGYEQNPPLEPLRQANVTDVIILKTHDPLHNDNDKPTKGAKLYHEEIHADVAAISLDDANRLNVHALEMPIANGEIGGWELNDTSKLNTSPTFIDTLYEAGRQNATKWLRHNFPYLGNESSYRPDPASIQKLMDAGLRY